MLTKETTLCEGGISQLELMTASLEQRVATMEKSLLSTKDIAGSNDNNGSNTEEDTTTITTAQPAVINHHQ